MQRPTRFEREALSSWRTELGVLKGLRVPLSRHGSYVPQVSGRCARRPSGGGSSSRLPSVVGRAWTITAAAGAR